MGLKEVYTRVGRRGKAENGDTFRHRVAGSEGTQTVRSISPKETQGGSQTSCLPRNTLRTDTVSSPGESGHPTETGGSAGRNGGGEIPPQRDVASGGDEEPRITLTLWDAEGPTTEDNVASFQIKDPNKLETKNQYCIGYKFLGGEMTDPSSWRYDHTAYWDFDAHPEIDYMDSVHVSRESLDALLEQHHTSVEELLNQYCEKLRARDK